MLGLHELACNLLLPATSLPFFTYIHHCHTCTVDRTYMSMCVFLHWHMIKMYFFNTYNYIPALYVYLLFKFRIIHCLYPVIPVFNSFIFFNAKPTAVLAFSMAFPEVRAMTQLATKCKLAATSVRKDPCWTALWKDVSFHCYCWSTCWNLNQVTSEH